MRTLKSVLLFGLFCLMISSCFDQPEFPTKPQITFEEIYFKEVGSNSDADSLVIKISFKDGDGDLGLSPQETDSPYHEQDYFLDDNGKLITVRSVGQPGNEDLPPFQKPTDCLNYVYDSLFIPENQKQVFDETYNIVDTLFVNGTTYYTLLDTFYIEKNPNHYNITVEFLQKVNNTFEVFDWRTIYPYPTCGETFDGRFPVLSDGDGNALEGNLKYALKSNGFLPFFSTKILKLRIQIRDRALNLSNVVESQEFTLDAIKRR